MKPALVKLNVPFSAMVRSILTTSADSPGHIIT